MPVPPIPESLCRKYGPLLFLLLPKADGGQPNTHEKPIPRSSRQGPDSVTAGRGMSNRSRVEDRRIPSPTVFEGSWAFPPGSR